MNSSLINAPSGRTEIWASERCYILELLNDPEVPQVSLARCRVEFGVTTQLHSLGVAEIYVILEGKGRMEVNGAPGFEVKAGDSVSIATGESQRITNTGSGDLVFKCICMPRFYPECYQPLEDETKGR